MKEDRSWGRCSALIIHRFFSAMRLMSFLFGDAPDAYSGFHHSSFLLGAPPPNRGV